MSKIKWGVALTLTFIMVLCPLASAEIATEFYSEDIFNPLPAIAPLDETSFTVHARSAILMEAETGEIIFQQNCHEPLAPASVTKIMTLLLVMEAIDAGKLTLDMNITPSEYACSMGGSQIWLEPNETMTVDELLRATVIASANDAAVALGEAVAGSCDAFVKQMNLRAAELGMADTNFINPTGLDEEGHHTSAYDIALMSRELLRHSLIKEYSTIWMDSLRGGSSQLVNTNKLIRFYEGATGLKTGTTSKAGHCLSASAQRGDMELIAVVLGSETSTDRFSSARQLLDFGFANYSVLTAHVPEDALNPVPVRGGPAKTIPIKADGSPKYLIMKTTETPTFEYILPEEISAPVAAGCVLGKAIVKLGESTLGEIPIIAAESVAKLGFWDAICLLWNALVNLG